MAFYFLNFSGRKAQGQWHITGILQLGVNRKENPRTLNPLGQPVWENHPHIKGLDHPKAMGGESMSCTCQHSQCFLKRLLWWGWRTNGWGRAELSSSPGSKGSLLQVCFRSWKENLGDPAIPLSAPQQDLGLDSASLDTLLQILAPDKHLSCTLKL